LKIAELAKQFNSSNDAPEVQHGDLSLLTSMYRRSSLLSVLLYGLTSSISSPFALCQERSSDATALSTASEVHNRPSSAPIAKVHLTGTVTYYDPSDGVMFFQDASGGTYVNTSKSYPVQSGDQVVIDGLTNSSFRTEVAIDPTIRVLGKGKTYPAPILGYSKLASGDADCLLVRFRGVVRAQDIELHQNTISGRPSPSIHLDLAMDGGQVEVYLGPSFGNSPKSMVDATVEMTGVAGGLFDAKNQLTGIMVYIASPKSIKVLEEPVAKLENLPLTEIDDVFPSRKVNDTSSRVRVRGVVTFYKKGDSAVLEHRGKSIYVQTRQTSELAIGDVVDAFGFASDQQYAPSLAEASLVKAGFSETLKPKYITYDQAFSGLYSDNLISMSGKLVSQLQSTGSDTLVIDTGGHLVSATLQSTRPLPSLLQNSKVQVTGICRIVPGGPFRAPALFHIEMRDVTDAQLIADPSWWTVGHLLEVLAAFLAVALAIAGWALLLRQRLVVQTDRIRRSMSIARERSRILEKINSNLTPEVLLGAVCETVTSLLPNVKCVYAFEDFGCSRSTPTDGEKGNAQQLYELDLHGKNGEILGWISVTELAGYVASPDRHEVFEMLTETSRLAVNQLLLHRALVHHSTHDFLTDLPNRRLCDTRFDDALEKAMTQGSRVAVIYIDIDRFKEVNDQHGHRIGDLYLMQISSRLLAAKRQYDTLARIGGDEFLLIMPLNTSYEHDDTVVSRLEACFADSFSIEGRLISGSASLGLARYPEHGQTAEQLKLHADHEMYASKRRKNKSVSIVASRIA
jgi:diguanylate cyclase (GGDEF)-like protein